MTIANKTLGIVGGSGMLGRALSIAILNNSGITESEFWLSNRSGDRAGFETYKDITVTTHNQSIADNCDIIILCVPPDQFSSLSITAKGKLVVSVMAGVSVEQIQQSTLSTRVVRAMSSPAAISQLAYSPWFSSADISDEDRRMVATIFNACGTTDELDVESHIELFTAMTGPVPGFVAFFAQCMTEFATTNGVNNEVAERAVKQLFLGAGTLMAAESSSPAQQVQEMIDYNGTTAAGLRHMQDSTISSQISNGLSAAVEKTKLMAT